MRKKTIEQYKLREYQVVYSWYENGTRKYGEVVISARTKKAVYPRLCTKRAFMDRFFSDPLTIQVEKITWIRPPKEDKQK